MIGVTKQIAQVGGQFGLSTRTLNQLGNKGIDPLQQQFEDMTKDVDKAGKGLNSATNSQSEMRDAQIKSAQNLNEFVKLGVAPATKAMQFLAEAIENVTSWIPGAGRTKKGVTSGKPTTQSGGGVEGVSVTGEVDLSGAEPQFNEPQASNLKTDVDKVLATIRQRESGGDYGIKSKSSSASGAYQFIDSTWQGLTKQANLGQEFKSAKEAPKEVQDAIAKYYVEQLLKQAGGDVSKVPLAWYTGNVQGKMSPEAMAANQGLTPEEYQRNWMKDYNKIAGPSGASAANGAILSGPTSGYRPNLTMHGTEAVVPLNTPAQQAAAGIDPEMITAQLDKLDEMIALMKNQLGVQTKLMQLSN
jgi:hypothetical protein